MTAGYGLPAVRQESAGAQALAHLARADRALLQREAGDGDGQGLDPEEFQRYFTAQARFTAGVATRFRTCVRVQSNGWRE